MSGGWDEALDLRNQQQYAPSPRQLQPTSSGLPFYLANDMSLGQVDPSTISQPVLADPSWSSPLARSWGLNQGLAAGQIQAGPQFALNQTYRDTLAQQLALSNASKSSESNYARADYNTGLSRLGLQEEKLGFDRNALGRQSPLSDTLHRLALESIGLGETSANQSADRAKRGAMSSAVTRGATSSPGIRTDLTDIQTQLENQLMGYGINRQEEDVRFNEQRASLADQNKVLDLQSRELNMSRDQLKTELDRGLDRLGLSTAMTVADLTGKMQSSAIEDQVLAQQIFNAALQSSDYYAQFYPYPSTPSTSVPTQSVGGSTRRAS